MNPSHGRPDRRPAAFRAVAERLVREASAELARLRRIRGAGRRTARRIAGARARVAFAAALVGAPLAGPALARAPLFTNPLVPLGLGDVGGHASPALADIDGDGDLDAFVGETDGNTLFFRNTGTANAPAFSAPVTNPFGLLDVGAFASPTFADVGGDGDLDAYVGESGGLTVFFLNTGTATAPAFMLAGAVLEDVGYDAAPSFADLDGDGDLDAFVGEGYGHTVFFENTGAAGAAFAAGISDPFGLAGVGFEASPSFTDLDGDGDLDALVGQDGGHGVFFANTGTATAPAFAAPVTDPFGLADVGDLAAPALGDVDGDGDVDILVGSFLGSTTLFTNSGRPLAPAFVGPIQLATQAPNVFHAPTFADIDGDGDPDAFVGLQIPPSTLFFANTGTARAPAFAVPVGNPFGLLDVGSYAAPAFADVDGDGDLDAFLGQLSGDTIFFENTGTASLPAFVPPLTNPFGLTDVGDAASPDFADVDGDGDLDAFVGELQGNTAFFENTGDARAPAFSLPASNPFGLGDVGYSSAPTLVDVDGDGDLDAALGERDGDTVVWTNTGTPGAPFFAAPVANPFGLAPVALGASPAFADLDGDGDLDAFLGADGTAGVFFVNLAPVCPPAPDPSCREFLAGSLSVDERKPGKEKLVAKLAKGPELGQADFGDPTAAGGTHLALCLYDDQGARVAAFEVDRAGESCAGKPCWKPLGMAPPDGKGFAYKDKLGSREGVRSLRLQGGGAGRSSLAVAASNRAQKDETALATGLAAALASTSEVTLLLDASDGACFQATLSDVTKQEADRFKAR